MPTKPLIVIVDDDEAACEGTVDLVKSMGFLVEGNRCAEDFLNSSYLAETSCLITDLRMPGMNGLDLHSHLRRLGKIVPTILVTAFPDTQEQARALKAGVICYLAKPFNDAELLDCVRLALDPSSGRDP